MGSRGSLDRPLEGSPGWPEGTQSSKTAPNRKDGNPPPHLGQERWGETRSRLKLRGPTRVHVYHLLHVQTGTQRGSEEKPPLLAARSPESVRPSKLPPQKGGSVSSVGTDLRGGYRPQGSGRDGAPTQARLGQGCVQSPADTLTPTPLGGPVHVSGAISLRTQKQLSILFLNHISQDGNLISQARL